MYPVTDLKNLPNWPRRQSLPEKKFSLSTVDSNRNALQGCLMKTHLYTFSHNFSRKETLRSTHTMSSIQSNTHRPVRLRSRISSAFYLEFPEEVFKKSFIGYSACTT
uniref:Uncharacterized protein n=1 Tax=Cacopsylla melanoneura TaxID=428564 RepID=A0A8D8XJZ0_9HEMI